MTKVPRAVTTLCALTMLVLGLVACDDSPTAPSVRPGPPSPAPTLPPIQVTGRVVDASGQSVAGARVTLPDRGVGTPAETMADAAGVYALVIDARYENFVVEVEKDGYEPSRLYVWLSDAEPGSEVTRNLRLHEVLRINAGDTVGLSIVEGDSVCEDFIDEWACRRVRVVSPVAGQLALEVPDGPISPWFRIMLPGDADRGSGSSVRIAVAAGSETIVDVMLVGRPTGTTTLTTRLEPS